METKNKQILTGVVFTLVALAVIGYASKGKFGAQAQKASTKLESTVKGVKSKIESKVPL